MRLKYFLPERVLLILIALFYFSTLHAQKPMSDYSFQWKKIDDFVNKGLTKSALTEVDKIYALARKTNNDVKIIKSL